MSPEPPESCFHCGLPVPDGPVLEVEIEGKPRKMCCHGCQAVAQAIVDSGNVDFYRLRTEPQSTGRDLVPEFLQQADVYDNPQIQKSFVRHEGETLREASLVIEGITCAACIWLNERHLAGLPGVLEAHINYSTHRASVRWDDGLIHLSDILKAVAAIGYIAHPYDPARQQDILDRERRQLLRRLLFAGLFGMQVMMIAVALYTGDWYGMDEEFRQLFRWTSLGLSLPVLFYSAQPFFRGLVRDIQRRSVGMDVPVSLGIGIAFAGSVHATWTGVGEIYFDSVSMFTFFLLAARFLELAARRQAASSAEHLVHGVPATATRLAPAGDGPVQQVVPVVELEVGDLVLVRPGESVPADGVVEEGQSSVDESLLTGESVPVARATGDALIGGTLNTESPLTMRVDKVGGDTVLAGILGLLDRAQAEKPAIARLADRVAAWFVSGILLLAGLVAIYWYTTDPSIWLPVTIAVLVATCPCALSLATPAATTAATGRLTREGLLVTRGHALETLARCTHIVLDKTGTLTEGKPALASVECVGDLDREQCLAVAAALEAFSEHPLAQALVDAATTTVAVDAVESVPGGGVKGRHDGVPVAVGTPAFVSATLDIAVDAGIYAQLGSGGGSVVVLADARGVQAFLVLQDRLRPHAADLVRALGARGRKVILLTGDHEQAARRVADETGIREFAFDLSPQDKLARVRRLQAQGATVMMMGDGVNDAPVLAGAEVSIAMGSGARLAAASADMVLLSDRLEPVIHALGVARKMLGVIRQNLVWALLYNLTILPLAATGWVAPWMAAIGMSASSLVVVANAQRLLRHRED